MSRVSLEDAVLALILDGAETPEEIASILRVDVEEVKRVLRGLEVEGLVRSEEKGFWIFKKKVYKLTSKGYEEAVKAKERLTESARKVRELLEKARSGVMPSDRVREEVEPYVPFIPLFLYWNLLDLMLLLPLIELPLIASLLDEHGIDYDEVDVSDTDNTVDEGFDGLDLD